jgi:hypothetical protein
MRTMLLTLLACAALQLRAEQAVPPARTTVGPPAQPLPNVQQHAQQKRALVLELLRVTNARQQAADTLKTMTEMMPIETRGVLRDSLNVDEMVAQVVPVYEKYLTVEEIQGLLAFYRSPLGQKIIAVQPKIMQDSMIVMRVYVEQRLAEMLKSEKQ